MEFGDWVAYDISNMKVYMNSRQLIGLVSPEHPPFSQFKKVEIFYSNLRIVCEPFEIKSFQ